MLRVVDDANTTVTDDWLAVYRITNFEGQLISWEFRLVNATREVQRQQDLVDAEVICVEHKNDAFDIVAILLQKSSDGS